LGVAAVAGKLPMQEASVLMLLAALAASAGSEKQCIVVLRTEEKDGGPFHRCWFSHSRISGVRGRCEEWQF
jgi:hypothetical protein